jgi:formylglycine-generating enzyme required for sulfatase activity
LEREPGSDHPALIAAVKCDSTYQTWTDAAVANEHRPMGCVTWYEAMAFCAWDGGYLPPEAEWNYAATGGDQQRAFPWSIPSRSLTIDGAHASYRDGTNCVGDGVAGCAVIDLVAVGTKPMGGGRWGQSDLAGNVNEWMLDWYADPYASVCTDCADLTPGSLRVFRGGGFDHGNPALRASSAVTFTGEPRPRHRSSLREECAVKNRQEEVVREPYIKG